MPQASHRDNEPVPPQTSLRYGQLMLAIPAAVLLVLIGRLVYIQTQMSPRLLAYAENQRTARRVLPARRGTILDRNGRILAASREVPSVFADAALVADVPATAAALSPVLDMPATEIERCILRIDTVPHITARLAPILKTDADLLAEMLTAVEHYLTSLDDMDEEIEVAVTELSKQIDWEPLADDTRPPFVDSVYPDTYIAEIHDNVLIEILDLHPSAGIDINSIEMYINDEDVTSDLTITGNEFAYKVEWRPPSRVYTQI